MLDCFLFLFCFVFWIDRFCHMDACYNVHKWVLLSHRQFETNATTVRLHYSCCLMDACYNVVKWILVISPTTVRMLYWSVTFATEWMPVYGWIEVTSLPVTIRLRDSCRTADLVWCHWIQTHKRFKITLFIRTKHNMRIFWVIPFIKLQNNT